MALTHKQVDELEKKAREGDVSAVKALAAAAREGATDEQLFRIETPDGIVREMTARQYLQMSATDLCGAKITPV